MALSAPGSFSKNFAWHGTGFLKLFSAIREGFSHNLVPVGRIDFRKDCGIQPDDLQLIPLNFFLHNHVAGKTNEVSVDELVCAAITKPHSQLFDRLALFCLHLNRAGDRLGKNGESAPALWIRDFVVNRLWHDGAWRPEAVDIGEMDAFFKVSLDADEEVRVKCRSNYRHMLGLCGYLTSAPDAIDSGAEQWLIPALFLTWDRLALDKTIAIDPKPKILLQSLETLDIHKLAGTTEKFLRECAAAVARNYLELGGLARFSRKSTKPLAPATSAIGDSNGSTKRPAKPGSKTVSTTAQSEESVLDYSVAEEIQRRLRMVVAQMRNTKHVRTLKKLYANQCQFCGTSLESHAR